MGNRILFKSITRKERESHINGVVGVIMKCNGGYYWLRSITENEDGCTSFSYDNSKMYDIINENRLNQKTKNIHAKL